MDDYQQFKIPIQPDEDRFTGRECPQCEGYFKVEFGTGLKDENLPCYCPYCGHCQGHDHFWTKEQIEYAQSVVLNQVTGQLLQSMKKLERRPNPRALIDIGIKVTGRPHPVHYYREKKLEQEVICNNCTLRYTIYGVFGFCPDCGTHNSYQILEANLDVIEKMIVLSSEHTEDIAKKLIDNALEDAVSALDGFGRELSKVYASKATNSNQAEKISFQNISGAKNTILALFAIDISSPFAAQDWLSIIKCFQKRHLLAHNMGVIDQKYIDATGESPINFGKQVVVVKEEVISLSRNLRKLAAFLKDEFKKLP